MERINLNVADGTIEALRAIAKDLDYIASEGRYPGTGNVTGLLYAIATGNAIVIRLDRPGARVQRTEHAIEIILPDDQDTTTINPVSLLKGIKALAEMGIERSD